MVVSRGGLSLIEVYDSLSAQLRPLSVKIPGHISIYLCGITPYDRSHLGHARPAVIWDVIRKHLRRRGYIVTLVQNVTDIDDKLIRRAYDTGRSVKDLTQQYTAEYYQAMALLGVEPPDFSPAVTEHLDSIVDYIQDLVAKGFAYDVDGSVYFRVNRAKGYGQLSGRKREDMLEGVRIEPNPGKEDPADFALWKRAHEQEPAWPSPWGVGRPGWHIECSALSERYLGEHFDMHGGGMDLLFPHHENERAQSLAKLGTEPVGLWVHSGLVTRQGVKMSKSLGNGTALDDLLKRYAPQVLRTYLLSAHYRKPLDFDEDRLVDWGHALERIQRLWDEVRQAPPANDFPGEDWARELAGFEDRFLQVLDEDFNTPRAFAMVFDTVKAANVGIRTPNAAVARGLARRNLGLANQILGFLPPSSDSPAVPNSLADEVLKRRDRARQEKDFALSDALREVLIACGYEVLDGPDGTSLRWARQSS